MKLLKNLGLSLALLSATTIHAQFEKGTKSYFGDAKMEFSSSTFSQYQGLTLNRTEYGLSPGIGSFLNDDIFMFGQGIFNSTSTSSTYLGNPNNKSSQSSYGGQLGVRLYAFNTPKYNLFAELSTSVLAGSRTGSGSQDILTPKISVGTNVMMNNTNALDIELSYSKIAELRYKNPFENSANLFALNVSLGNFISSKNDEEDMTDLTTAGRNTINGSFTYGVVSYSYDSKSILVFNPDYGHFVAKNLMLGAKLNMSWQSAYDAVLSLQPYIRYYIPVSNKLFVYPNANLNYNNDNQTTRYFASTFTLNYAFGVGATYFIKRNLALEGDILKYELNEQSKVFYAGLNFGLKYFIR
jgi:hypothetical protein